MKSILAFHAHPDDESVSTGITLAKYAAEGHRVVVATATDGSAGEIIGQVTDIVFPYACCQDPSGVTECSGNTWPLTVQVITTAASGSCANSKYTGGDITINGITINGDSVTTLEGYEVIGQSKKGAPYRNPILGYRKFLASDLSCCLVENSSTVKVSRKSATNNIYKDMHAKYTGKKNFLKLLSIPITVS